MEAWDKKTADFYFQGINSADRHNMAYNWTYVGKWYTWKGW